MRNILKFLVMLVIVGIFSLNVNANTSKYDNPYPDVFSDEEISKAIEEGKNKNKFYYITKVYLERDGKQTLIPDKTYQWFVKPGDKFKLYAAIVNQANFYQASGTFGWNSNFTLYTVNDNKPKILDKGKVDNRKIDITNVEFTGDQKVENENGKLKIVFNKVEKPYFLYAQFELPKDFDLSGSLFVGGKFGSQNEGGSSASTSISFYSLQTYTYTKFHFVNDLSYRKLKQLDLNSPLSERSFNDGKDSNKAFEVLDLEDLKLIETSSAFSRAFGVVEAPFLRPENEDENISKTKKPEFFFEPSENGIEEDGNIFSNREKPSLNDLLKQDVKGYVYIDNDIDKTSENNYLSLPGILDGKYVDTKHYYLTYRPIPKVLKVVKKDKEDSKVLEGGLFDLYYVYDGKEILVKKDLRTGSDGEFISDVNANYETLKEIAKENENLMLEKNSYIKNDNFYLLAGNYRLKETNAPKDYKKLEKPIDFKVDIIEDEKNYVHELVVFNEKESKETNVIPNNNSNKKTEVLPDTGVKNNHKIFETLFLLGALFLLVEANKK